MIIASMCAGGAWAQPRWPAALAAALAHGGRQAFAATASAHIPTCSIVDDSVHPIRDHHITPSVWECMVRLQGAGHAAYLVGGTVRDILLGRAPKDYDLLTTADLQQVRRLFRGQAFLVGKKFPICLVRLGDEAVVEVASLHTTASPGSVPPDACQLMHRRHSQAAWVQAGTSCGSKAHAHTRQPAGPPTWAAARAANAVARDFTANALLYDPFGRLLFDYVGGLPDIGARRLAAIGDAEASLAHDPVRLLRAVRCAARTGLRLEPSLAAALSRLAPRVASLGGARLKMEVAALLAYGAAAPSLQLLWRHGLLEWLLPLHAEYFQRHALSRDAPESAASDAANSSNLLLSLLEQLDVRASVSKPASPEVCLAVLACPLVVEQLASTARQLHAALSSELELSSDVGLPSASEELAGGEPGSSPGSTGSAADWPGSEAAARQQPGASSSGRAGAGDAWAVLGALGPTAKAVLRGKQGLEALMRAAIVEAVKQVAAASVPGKPSVSVLAENKAHAAAMLLLTHWRLCHQRAPAQLKARSSRSRNARQHAAACVEQPPAGVPRHPWPPGGRLEAEIPGSMVLGEGSDGGSSSSSSISDNSSSRDLGAPTEQQQARHKRSHTSDASSDLYEELLAGGTRSGIVWLKPPPAQQQLQPQQALAAGDRGFHSSGAGAAGAAQEQHAGGLSSAEVLVHEVLYAAGGCALQELSDTYAACRALHRNAGQS